MKSSLLTQLPRPVPAGVETKNILQKSGYGGAILTLPTGGQIAVAPAQDRQDHLLFLLDGEISVEQGGIHSLLRANDAMLVADGRDARIENRGTQAARLVRFDVPSPPDQAPLYQFPGKP